MEGIDHPLGVWIEIANIDQMETDHKDDEEAFQEVYLVNPLHI